MRRKDQAMKKDEQITTYVRVDGMFCAHCLDTVSLAIKTLPGVGTVRIRQNVAQIISDEPLKTDEVISVIRKAGYETDADKISSRRGKVAHTIRWYEILLISAVVIFIAVSVNRIFGFNVFNAIPTVDSGIS